MKTFELSSYLFSIKLGHPPFIMVTATNSTPFLKKKKKKKKGTRSSIFSIILGYLAISYLKFKPISFHIELGRNVV